MVQLRAPKLDRSHTPRPAPRALATVAGGVLAAALTAQQPLAAPLPANDTVSIGPAADGAVVVRAADDLEDGAITARVKSRLALDEAIRSRDIRVATKDAAVTLSGQVASDAEREKAVKLARETEGVKSVVDRLEVKK
jgi:hyperosmotically inducible protein